jgi:chromosome segregation protein
LHAIVGQGRLDEILQSRPEDRRQYIEEAAGIAKHRRRRERAERKLAGVEQDVLRLNDVVAELRRQLKPLEKQAELAEKHDGDEGGRGAGGRARGRAAAWSCTGTAIAAGRGPRWRRCRRRRERLDRLGGEIEDLEKMLAEREGGAPGRGGAYVGRRAEVGGGGRAARGDRDEAQRASAWRPRRTMQAGCSRSRTSSSDPRSP